MGVQSGRRKSKKEKKENKKERRKEAKGKKTSAGKRKAALKPKDQNLDYKNPPKTNAEDAGCVLLKTWIGHLASCGSMDNESRQSCPNEICDFILEHFAEDSKQGQKLNLARAVERHAHWMPTNEEGNRLLFQALRKVRSATMSLWHQKKDLACQKKAESGRQFMHFVNAIIERRAEADKLVRCNKRKLSAKQIADRGR